MKKLLLCVGMVLMLSACSGYYDHSIRFSHGEIAENEEPRYEGRSHFFFWGMGGQHTDFDLSDKCQGRGVKAIEARWSFWDSFWGGMTMGIYAPESFAVWCN